jgi:hypothetical protein
MVKYRSCSPKLWVQFLSGARLIFMIKIVLDGCLGIMTNLRTFKVKRKVGLNLVYMVIFNFPFENKLK